LSPSTDRLGRSRGRGRGRGREQTPSPRRAKQRPNNKEPSSWQGRRAGGCRVSAAPLTWYRLRWPREVSPEQLAQSFRLLSTMAGAPIVLEARGTTDRVLHRLAVPEGRAGVVAHQLRAVMPG